ncbi:MAG: universal stress protein [Anaerolineales bacterium]
MYKRILVPLDGSARAEQILPHVEELALRFESEVILLRVIEPDSVYTDFAQIQFDLQAIERKENEAESYLAAKRDELKKMDIPVRVYRKLGDVVLAIIEIARAEEVDLIALASHGRSGLARVFYGSVASALLQRIDRPLLLIRSGDE